MVHFFVWGETRERIRNGIIYLHFLACLFSFSFLYIKKNLFTDRFFGIWILSLRRPLGPCSVGPYSDQLGLGSPLLQQQICEHVYPKELLRLVLDDE